MQLYSFNQECSSLPRPQAQAPDPIDVMVGARMRQRRKELGLTQTALAEAFGITFQQVQKYERGANRVSASMLKRASVRLDCPVSFFFNEDPSQAVLDLLTLLGLEEQTELRALLKTPRVAELLRDYRDNDHAGQAEVLRVAKQGANRS